MGRCLGTSPLSAAIASAAWPHKRRQVCERRGGRGPTPRPPFSVDFSVLRAYLSPRQQGAQLVPAREPPRRYFANFLPLLPQHARGTHETYKNARRCLGDSMRRLAPIRILNRPTQTRRLSLNVNSHRGG